MQNAERDTSGRNQYKRHERIIPLVISCFSAAKVLEPVEKAFYHISTFIGFFIKWPWLFCVCLRRNRVFSRLTVQIFPNLFCAVGLVTKDITVLQTGELLEQRNGFCAVINITSRQQKSNRTQILSDQSMNFRVQASVCFADAA